VTAPIPGWWHDDPGLAAYLTRTYGSLQRAADVLHTEINQTATPPGWTYIGTTDPGPLTGDSPGVTLGPGRLYIAPPGTELPQTTPQDPEPPETTPA
jgi:hypothetical protein